MEMGSTVEEMKSLAGIRKDRMGKNLMSDWGFSLPNTEKGHKVKIICGERSGSSVVCLGSSVVCL